MASSKRRRDIVSDDGEQQGEDSVEVETAQSSIRHSLNKRPRLSSAVDDDDDDNAEVSGEEMDLQGGQADQDNDELDPRDEVDEDALVDEMRNSRHVLEQLGADEANIPSDCGIIEEVFCRNFMCHSKLRIKLGPLINFIIGHNGSGKSAVMTALTICLGVKATATNRGSSLKSFIKEGEESAMLSVKIKNQGDLAYRTELYGDSIIVERHFTRSGTSSFKIKSAMDRVITTKKSDLEDMLDSLALQLDNPLNVLSQDSARQFLSSSTPRDKYKFFLKGTQLEQLDNDYRIMEQYVDQTEAKLESRASDMDALKQRMLQAESKKKVHDKSQSIRERITHLQWMHAWAQVEVIERQLAESQTRLQQARDKIDEKEAVLKQKSDIYDKINADYEAAVALRTDFQSNAEPIREKFNSVKEVFDANKNALLDENTERRKIQSDLKASKEELTKTESQIRGEEARIEAAQGPAQARRLAELEEARNHLEDKKAAEEALDKRPLDAAVVAAEQKVRDVREARETPRQKLAGAEQKLRNLQDKDQQQMAAFAASVPQLLIAIQNDDRFHQKPVGPMGLHVRLMRPEWSSVIESWCAGALEAFVVSNKHDQGILSDLMRKHRCISDIFIGKGTWIDVRPREPDAEHDTILRVLEIDNDLVRNQLIINQRIEQVVLIDALEDGMAFMKMKNGQVPRNVQFTLCHHPRDPQDGVRVGRTGKGNMGTGPVKAFTRRARMKTDIPAQIRMQTEIVTQAKRDLNEADKRVREAEMELKRANEALTRYQRIQKDCRVERQQAMTRVEELQDMIEQSTVDVGRLDALKAQRQEAMEALSHLESSYRDAVIAKDRLAGEQRALKDDMDRYSAEIEEEEQKVKKVDLRVTKYADKRQTALAEKNLAHEFVTKSKDDCQEAEAQVGRRQAEVDDFVQQATVISGRIAVEDGMSADMIDKRIDKLQNDIAQADSRAGGTREEVIEAYYKAKKEYNQATKGLRELEAVSNHLKRSLNQRKYRWGQFRKYITARAKFMFTYLLSERAFRGRIIVHHQDMAMDISVEPDIAKSSDRGRQTRTLSGGEKSFSTICLLLSIWEAMGSPIRCLDEFDVFMDNVNRDISMKMMIGAARRSVGKQFILITPQAMGNVQLGPDVRIHKMSDPERGQTTLGFAN